MAGLTESNKETFNHWMLELLKNADNKAAIILAKPGVTFDTAGTVTVLEGKETAYQGKEGAIVAVKAQLATANEEANTTLNEWYKDSSNAAEAVVGHCGKDHPLSKLIRNKRDSFSNDPTPPTA